MKLELERTIGNHDEDFLNNWYKKPQQYSLHFVKDVATFCNTTITCLTNEIQNTENKLQHILEKDTYQEIQNTINTNQTIRDRSLKQRKLKKFNQLNYKPRQTQQHITQEELLPEEQEANKRQMSYVAALWRGAGKSDLFPEISNTNIKKTFCRTNNSERQQNLPIAQQLDIRKKQVEIKKKESETTFQQTETDESHPKFTEMQKQIKCLTT